MTVSFCQFYTMRYIIVDNAADSDDQLLDALLGIMTTGVLMRDRQ